MVGLFVIGILIIVLLFGFVLLFGAPYLPTLAPQVTAALDLIDLQAGDHLLELGCGDGKVLIAAAERGMTVTGYELNPLLAFIAWARTRRYRDQVRIICGNFWQITLPPTDGIFVFLLPKYMNRLDKKVMQEKQSKVKLVSFAFMIPGKPIAKEQAGVYLYQY